MAPLDGALYANLLRVVALGDQRTLGNVLDTALNPFGPSCTDGARTTDATAAASPCEAKVWLQATGSNVSLNDSPDLDTTGFHLLAGTDGVLGDVVHVGVEAGAGQIHASAAVAGRGRIRDQVRSVHAGFYAFADAGPWVISATVDAMHSNFRVHRNTGIGLASAAPGGRTLSGGLQAAWPIAFSGGQLTPKLGVLYQHQTLDGFSERVASTSPLAPAYAVTGTQSTATSLQPYAALVFASTFRAHSVTYVPQLELGYRYDARGNTPTVQVTALDGTSFALPGTAVGRGVGEIGAKVTAELDGSWSLYLDYHGLFASHLHDNALTVGFTKQF